MGMFDKYDNLQDNYIPNNKPKPPKKDCGKLDPCRAKKPYEEYNAQGELIGYYWYEGNLINLEFNIEGEIIIDTEDQQPEDNYIDVTEFLKDKQITVDLYNFRREIIKTRTYEGSSKIIFEIDDELAKELVKGVYYISLTVWTDTTLRKTIFQQQDCVLNVR